jgi:hypothetical protein
MRMLDEMGADHDEFAREYEADLDPYQHPADRVSMCMGP